MTGAERGGAGRRDLRVAIIGAGMAGILAAIELRKAGIHDFTIHEKADRVGGTWRENTYPGLACDVPSHLYSYSFAPNPEWSRPYSPGEEIQAYFEAVFAEHGLAECTRFGDEIVRCEFGDDGRWTIASASGAHEVVDAVIAATGVLHKPRYPDIDGLDTFAGRTFHSARWDHDAVLDGARVGIIGTGSTAVQIVSAVRERVAHLALFQRTAQWVMPQPNEPYTDEQRALNRSDLDRLRAAHTRLSELFGGFTNAVIDAQSPMAKMIGDLCLANLEDNVTDPALRERLRPDYQAACKRLIVSPDFYTAIQHPNAELVTDAIEGVEPGGVRTADGRLHELDVLVLATGFHADAFMRPMQLVGSDGCTLEAAWRDRPSAYLAISMPEFPNFFMLNGPNGPVGNFSLIEVAELQVGYVLQLLEQLRAGTCRAIAPTVAATERFEAERVEAARSTVWMTGCRSWYLDDRGVPATWPWTFDRFRAEMAAPKLEAFDLR